MTTIVQNGSVGVLPAVSPAKEEEKSVLQGSVAPSENVSDSKVSKVALPVIVESFDARRQRVWNEIAKKFQVAKDVLSELSLGWDVGAQTMRVAGLVLLGKTENEQKKRIEESHNEKELLLGVQHIQSHTIPGFAKIIPSSEAFKPLVTFLKEEIPPAIERLLMEFQDKSA